jgi:DNA-binding MarR family transcriptional regulator
MRRQPSDADYRRLLEFRTSLRRFLRWSEQQARAQNLTPAQHQLLLAIKGHPDEAGPSIGDVAGYLLLRHHSAVGLIDRAEAKGLVRRTPDPEHRSTVRLTLTEDGARRLEALSELHLEEVPRLANTMRAQFAGLDDDEPDQITGRAAP